MKISDCEIGFYHLSKYQVFRALPRLLDKILQLNKNCLILCSDQQEMLALDEVIWTFASKAFLPHGTICDQNPEIQPVLLTTELKNLNNAEILIILNQTLPVELSGFKRCIDMFYNEATIDKDAEARLQKYRDHGHKVVYWIQNEEGNWQER